MSETVEILVTIPLPDKLIEEIRRVSEFIQVTVQPAREVGEVPEEIWAKAEILYTMHVLPKPEQAPALQWVQSYLAGVEKILEDELFKGEVALTTMSGANATQVAEHVLTMILALGHSLPEFLRLQRETKWMEDKGHQYVPREVRGSTVGVIGYGSIGRQVARLVTGMGAQVLAVKRDAMSPVHYGYSAEGLGDPDGDFFTRLYPPQAIQSMVKDCDFVVVTVPRTDETIGLVGKEQLMAMKPSAFLIDVSRGGVVDHAALIEAITETRIAGAALDVFPEEPLLESSPLWSLPNVIITPHVAGFSPAYNQRANDLFIENLTRYLSGQVLLNLVKQEREY